MPTSLTNRTPYNKLYINVTYDCNFKCSFCFKLDRAKVPESSTKMIESVEYLLKNNKYDIVIITGGEPFAVKETLRALVFKIRSLYQGAVHLMTNGSMIDESDVRYLNANRIFVALAFNSVFGTDKSVANVGLDKIQTLSKIRAKSVIKVLNTYDRIVPDTMELRSMFNTHTNLFIDVSTVNNITPKDLIKYFDALNEIKRIDNDCTDWLHTIFVGKNVARPCSCYDCDSVDPSGQVIPVHILKNVTHPKDYNYMCDAVRAAIDPDVNKLIMMFLESFYDNVRGPDERLQLEL